MEIRTIPISAVEPWDKNPRAILKKDFERLKKQILKLGVYKPLVCYEDSGKFVALGGNMRLRALQELGMAEVDISIVHPKTEAAKIEYNLSDNDRVGFYQEQELAELVFPFADDIGLEDYKIDLGESSTLKEILKDHGPGEENEAQEESEPMIICPNCGFSWPKKNAIQKN